MKSPQFLKACGAAMALTTDGVYQFPGQVVSLLSEIRAWDCMTTAAVIKKGKYDIHILHAYNGRYFKYDGPGSPEDCINVVAYDTQTGEAFMIGCRIAWSKKECYEHVLSYRKMITGLAIEVIDANKADEKRSYSWRFFS